MAPAPFVNPIAPVHTSREDNDQPSIAPAIPLPPTLLVASHQEISTSSYSSADGRERTPRLVKWTVQATRKPKQHEAPATLYDRWRAEATERGVDADSLVREVTGWTANRVQDQTVSDEATGRLFDRLAGPDGLTEHVSTFARPDVLVALGAGLAGAGRAQLEGQADRFLAEQGQGSPCEAG